MSGRRYTAEELDRIFEMYRDGRPVKEIAVELGRGRESINNILYRYGVYREGPTKVEPVHHATSLCWSCARSLNYATRTCEWAQDFEPVPGWDAYITDKGFYNTAIHDSYFVRSCPKYEHQEEMDNFERAAIRANQEQEPFYRLLAAIYKGMTEDYWGCCETITNKGASLIQKDDAASRLLYLRDFFKDSKALPILEQHTRRHDLVMRYLDNYQWRMERRRLK